MVWKAVALSLAFFVVALPVGSADHEDEICSGDDAGTGGDIIPDEPLQAISGQLYAACVTDGDTDAFEFNVPAGHTVVIDIQRVACESFTDDLTIRLDGPPQELGRESIQTSNDDCIVRLQAGTLVSGSALLTISKFDEFWQSAINYTIRGRVVESGNVELSPPSITGTPIEASGLSAPNETAVRHEITVPIRNTSPDVASAPISIDVTIQPRGCIRPCGTIFVGTISAPALIPQETQVVEIEWYNQCMVGDLEITAAGTPSGPDMFNNDNTATGLGFIAVKNVGAISIC